jgi:hypothetical protein
MMPSMKKRTTLTLDADVVARLDEEVHRKRKPFKQVVNDALRRGLSGAERRAKLPPYRLVPHKARLMPGIDELSLNRLVDELETEAFVAKMKRERKQK